MEILGIVARRMARSLAACTGLVAISLALGGEAALIPAYLLGYLVGAVTIWTMGTRIWRCSALSAANARKQMLWGLFLRLAMLFVVLFAAIHISVGIFGAVTAGFLLFYALAMAHLAAASLAARQD